MEKKIHAQSKHQTLFLPIQRDSSAQKDRLAAAVGGSASSAEESVIGAALDHEREDETHHRGAAVPPLSHGTDPDAPERGVLPGKAGAVDGLRIAQVLAAPLGARLRAILGDALALKGGFLGVSHHAGGERGGDDGGGDGGGDAVREVVALRSGNARVIATHDTRGRSSVDETVAHLDDVVRAQRCDAKQRSRRVQRSENKKKV